MKKVTFALFMLLLSMPLLAQRRTNGVTIQPKVGLNIADLTSISGSGSRVGLATGAEFEFPITRKFSISAGVLFSMQGCDGIELNYINLPAMANFYVVPGLAMKVGLQPGFNVSDDGFATQSPGLSLPLGMSYEYRRCVWDLRYNWGLTDALEHTDCKNSVFQFTFGYKFNL